MPYPVLLYSPSSLLTYAPSLLDNPVINSKLTRILGIISDFFSFSSYTDSTVLNKNKNIKSYYAFDVDSSAIDLAKEKLNNYPCVHYINKNYSEAVEILKEKGFTQLYHLKGGINAWKQNNKPVEGSSQEPQMTTNEYQQKITADSLVLVDFGADWCPPCKKMEPIIAQLLKENTAIKLVKVDGGKDLDVMKQMNVEALPVFIVYKNGKQVWKKQGIVSIEELKAQLQ